MSRQITITLSDEVYQGLETVAGGRSLSEFIEDLARPVLAQVQLEAAYREMSLDRDRELAANDWAEALIGDATPGGPSAAK